VTTRTFVQTTAYSLPSQGDFTINPKVKVFSNSDYNLLETDINSWFSVQTLVDPPVRFIHVNDVKFSTSLDSAPMPEIIYSALVFYDELLII
jgi:hypothetical protein